MNLKLTIAAIAIVGMPLYAQAQQGAPEAPKATNADAQRVVKMISADKAKSQAYCDMTKIGDQIEQAQLKHDDKMTDDLAQKADELAGKLGPEWDALMNGLQTVDENSKDGQAIAATLQSLDKICPK
jgi:hypothetical protein